MAGQKTIVPPQRPVPVVADVDVVVAGGGTAGVAAALAAARQGVNTFIVEAQGSLGGTLSNGLMETALTFAVPYMFHEGRPMAGLLGEMMQRVNAMAAESGLATGPSSGLLFDAELMKYVALQIVEEAGIQMLYHAMVDDVLMEDDKVKGIILATKAGRQAILCKQVIDASGDADLAAMAGVPFQVGHPRDGHGQAVTLMFRIGGVDEERLPREPAWWDEAVQKAVAAGDLELPEHVIDVVHWRRPSGIRAVGRRTLLPGIRSVNIDILDTLDGSKPENITIAQNECRKRIMKYISFCRSYVPGCEKIFLVDTAPMIGFRESRRIAGDYVFTWDDMRNGRKFDDSVWATVMPMDLHDRLLIPGQDPPAIHTWGGPIQTPKAPEGDYAQVPFRTVLAQKTVNLQVAGRCASCDYFTQGAFRMVPTCVATGQAAGTAAALAVKEGVELRELPIKDLQDSLRAQGVDLGGQVHAPEPVPPTA